MSDRELLFVRLRDAGAEDESAHLHDGMRRELVTESEREVGRLAGTRDVAIAFADLVGYTRLGEQLPAEDLGSIAGRFADLAVASVKRPATLIKTIGDGAMFASPEVPPLLAILQRLVESVAKEDERLALDGLAAVTEFRVRTNRVIMVTWLSCQNASIKPHPWEYWRS